MNIKILDVNIKISIWLLLIFILIIVTNNINNYCLFISFIFLHELGHIVMAKCVNVKLSTFYVLPVGFCAQLKGIESLGKKQELLIDIAGPSINLIIAFVCYILKFKYLMVVNLLLGLFNLLPLKPLDGYRIIRNYYGTKISNRLSYFLTAAMLILAIILAFYIKNYSLILLIIYILGFNHYSSKFNLYSFIKELMLVDTKFKNGMILKTNLISCRYECLIFDIIKSFDLDKYNIICAVDENNKIKGMVSQSQIIKWLKDINYNTRLEELVS